MKLIIDIPEDALKEMKTEEFISIESIDTAIECIKNGIPLDDVKAEIEEMRIKFMEQGGVYEHSAYGLDYATVLLDNIGKAESEDT